MKRTTLPFEQAAEHRTNLEGWVCETCRRFWGDDERMARWCCASDLLCATEGCTARVRKSGWTICDPCRERKAADKWAALPEIPWDGDTPLCLDDDDRYFFSAEDLDGFLEDNDVELEDLRLLICVRDPKPRFEVDDLLQDYLSDEVSGNVSDSTDIEKAVNEWIEQNVPQMWVPGKTRPTLDSVRSS